MKHLYLLLICATLLSSCGQFAAPTTHSLPTHPDTLAAMRLQTAGYEEQYARYDGVFLISDQLHDSHSAGYTKCTKLCYLVLKPDKEWLTTFKVNTDEGEQLSDVHISIVAPDGSVRTFGKQDLHSETSSDKSTVWKLAYPNISKGTIIEENYVVDHPGHIEWSQDVPLQMTLPCQKKRFVYSYPKWWDVQVKANGEATPAFYQTESDREKNKTLFVYEENMVQPREWEPYSPYFKEVGKYTEILVHSTNKQYRSVSTDEAWRYFASHYRKHVLDKESMWSGKVRSTTEEITKQCSTKVQKLEAITTYIQQNISIGKSSADDNFSDVLEKKEATPYVSTALAKKMLEKLEIPSDFILIHSARDGHFDINYVTPDQLYIPALYVAIDTEQYVVFPYYKNVPIDLIPEPFQKQQALRINEDGYNGFFITPKARDIDNTTDEKYTLTIDEEGKIKVDEEKTLRGFTAYSVRDRLDNMKPEEVEKEMKDMLTYTEGDIKLLSHEVINRSNLREPLVIKLSYEIDNLVTVTPEEVLFQTAGLLSPASSYMQKADTAERRTPIKVRYTEMLNKDITINYPQSWSLTTAMEGRKIENTFGSVESTIEMASGKLTIKQQRILLKADESKTKYRELLRIIGKNSGMAVPTLIFSAQGS